MIHIKKVIYAKTYDDAKTNKKKRLVEGPPMPVAVASECGALLVDGDLYVNAALASDCDACRAIGGVGGKNEKTWGGKTLGIRPEPVLDPNAEPLRDSDGKIYERIKP